MVAPRSVLSCNGASIPFSSQYFDRLPAVSAADVFLPERAATELRRHGVLRVTGLLDRELVLSVRGAYFGLFDRAMLEPGSDPRDGVFSGTVPDTLPAHGVKGHPAHSFVRSDVYQRFAAQPALSALAEAILGGPVLQLRRRPIRHFLMGRNVASRAHVDLAYLDRGTHRIVTMWIPIGDCPVEAGGLVYLEHSHQLNARALVEQFRDATDRPSDYRSVTHDLKRLADVTQRRWLFSNYAAGDVVIHTPEIIHASLDSQTPLMRLSTDIRFIPASDDVDPRWMDDWSADDGN
jgi:ectoine hydroxylase-related dioxygenase (phytanoyl-CoA dioxygenase family)